MFSKITLLTLAVLFLAQNAWSRSVYDSPPPHEEKAKMARYVVHKSDWTSLGTISTQKGIKGYPFVGIKSVSDGPADEEGNGQPYMMMTPMDVSMIDLEADNKCTLFFSLAQGSYCKDNNYDPQDPRCARIMLTGSVARLEKGSEEHKYANNSLLSRHPVMKNWPENHGFFIVKVDVIQVAVLDYFGGIEYVEPKDYFNANLNVPYIKYMDEKMNGLKGVEVKLIY